MVTVTSRVLREVCCANIFAEGEVQSARWDMFARVSSFQGPPDRTAEGIRVAREQILPSAKLQDGFRGIYLLFDSESGKSLSITLWESEEDMKASEEAALRARSKSAEASGDVVLGVERYEVALQELNQ
jgi:heme-degrading monooxygenase HmoA